MVTKRIFYSASTKKSRRGKKRAASAKKTLRVKKMRKSAGRKTKIRRRRHTIKGGGNNSPFIGAAYSNSGLNVPAANYYAPSPNGIPSGSPVPLPSNPAYTNVSMPQPSTNLIQNGGRRKRKGKGMQRGGMQSGGSFFTDMIPTDVLNMTRSVPAAFSRFISGWEGENTLASNYVYPTDQPLARGERITGMAVPPPDIMQIYKNADSLVSRI
jgi:hypothetical protein